MSTDPWNEPWWTDRDDPRSPMFFDPEDEAQAAADRALHDAVAQDGPSPVDLQIAEARATGRLVEGAAIRGLSVGDVVEVPTLSPGTGQPPWSLARVVTWLYGSSPIPDNVHALRRGWAQTRTWDPDLSRYRPLTDDEIRAALARPKACVSVVLLRPDRTDWTYPEGGLRRGVFDAVRLLDEDDEDGENMAGLRRLRGDDDEEGWTLDDDPLGRVWGTAADAMAEVPGDWWEEEPGCWMAEVDTADLDNPSTEST